MRALLRLGVLVCLAAAAGCGFHLRGAVEVPEAMSRTRIEGLAPQEPLGVRLARALESSGVRVVREGDAAVLKVHENRVRRRVLSVDSAGNAREYELNMRVSFSVRDGDRTLVPRQELSLVREYSFDPTQVLGKQSEAERLTESMVGDMVQLMLRRIEAARAAESS